MLLIALMGSEKSSKHWLHSKQMQLHEKEIDSAWAVSKAQMPTARFAMQGAALLYVHEQWANTHTMTPSAFPPLQTPHTDYLPGTTPLTSWIGSSCSLMCEMA
jgi:hypothetical protein